jgi:hypothetical protein
MKSDDREREIERLKAALLRGPIDVRWKCAHEWTPHVFPGGHESSIDYDCLRCGTAREFGAWPENGPDPIRRWIARKLRWPWVIR